MAPPDLCRTERPPRRMAVCCFPPYIRRCGSDSSISAGTFRTANPGVGQVAATRHVHTRLFDLLRVVANGVSLPGCLCEECFGWVRQSVLVESYCISPGSLR